MTFFREKNSPFPSGQASRNTLAERVVQTEVQLQYQCRWDKREYSLEASQVLTEMDVASVVESKNNVQMLSLPRSEASLLKTYSTGTKFSVISVEEPWLRVREDKSSLEGWVLSSQVKTRHDDLGYFTTIIRTPLRMADTIGAPVITYIPQREHFKALRIGRQFIKIQYKDLVGYAELSHFATRADFATLVYHPQTKWQAVKYRVGAEVQTRNQSTIALSDARGFVTSPKKGLVIQATSEGPPLQAHVEILKPKAYIWAQSQLSGHGFIWWKKDDFQIGLENRTPNTLTTDELMKREVLDIALEGKDSLRGLVSSHGIYRTEDGQNWERIDFFGEGRNPIAIHPNGNWFVGAYRSRDRGKSFEPFIRWDKIAQAIEQAYQRNPRVLRLNKIETLPNSRIAISVDTGTRSEVKLQSLIGDFSWNIIRN